MADITETPKTVLENEIESMFKKLSEHIVADINATKQWAIEETVLSSWGRGVIERLKEEAAKELRDEIDGKVRDEIEAEVSEREDKALRGAIGEILQIKEISVLDFTPLERMEMEHILKDFHL